MEFNLPLYTRKRRISLEKPSVQMCLKLRHMLEDPVKTRYTNSYIRCNCNACAKVKIRADIVLT